MNERDSERLMRAIGEIDEELIAEADRPRRRGYSFGRMAAMAACLVLVVSAAVMISRLPSPELGGDASWAPSAPNDGSDGATDPDVGGTVRPETKPPEDSGEHDAPSVPSEPGDNGTADGEGDSPAGGEGDASGDGGLIYECDGAEIRVLDRGRTSVRLGLTVTGECAPLAVRFVAVSEGKSYVVGDGDGERLGEVRITVDGVAAEELPSEIGDYEVVLDIGDAVGELADLEWVLWIEPIGKIG